MNAQEFRDILAQGENSSVEFKTADLRPESLAKEMVAFANSSGGTIVIGVSDTGELLGCPDGSTSEEWVMNIARNNIVPPLIPQYQEIETDGKRLCLVQVPKGVDKPYQTGERYLIRVGSTNRVATQAELMRLFQISGVFHYDTVAVPGTSANDLNSSALDTYFTQYGLEYSREEESARQKLLINTDILAPNGETTVAGMLLFGSNPSRHLPQTGIMFAHFHGAAIGEELIDRQEIVGTLPLQIDTALAVLKNNLMRPSRISGAKRTDEASLPPDKVFRELLVNAAVHRNYALHGSRIRVFMFADRIECISPGRLPNTVTVEKLRSGVSYATNPVLLKFMDNLRYVDRLGRGFPMIYNEIEKIGGSVEIKEIGEELRVILRFADQQGITMKSEKSSALKHDRLSTRGEFGAN